jgi:hypothetical protein
MVNNRLGGSTGLLIFASRVPGAARQSEDFFLACIISENRARLLLPNGKVLALTNQRSLGRATGERNQTAFTNDRMIA